MQGWLKFFFSEQNKMTEVFPKKFEFNSAFSAQTKKSQVYFSERDQWGPFNIPSDTSFFFMLTKNTIYVVNSRRV